MIRLEEVCLAFGDRRILSEESIEFLDGHVYIVTGPSGIGKTTLLNLAAGYLTPQAGRVVRSGDVDYLMQDELLFSQLTVLENLQIRAGVAARTRGSLLGRDALEQALTVVGLTGRGGDRVALLSGGERRRVELAGCLLNDSTSILLDEPVAHLDFAAASAVYDAVWRIATDRAVVIVTHEPSTAALGGPFVSIHMTAAGLKVS